MKRIAGVWVLLATLGGCVTTETGSGPSCGGGNGTTAATIPGVQGPWGQPVPMMTPAPSGYTLTEAQARSMMNRSVPLDQVLAAKATSGKKGSGIIQASAWGGAPAGPACGPGGCGGPTLAGGVGCGPGGSANVMTTPPGMPLGPIGAGVIPPGAVAAVGALPAGMPGPFPTQRTSVRFASPAGMKVSWYAAGPDGRPGFEANELRVPGRYNFSQAAIYRLKLSDIPNRGQMVLYPTLEVVPANCKTATFLAHSSVPVVFTDEDFDQVASGSYVVKVIYLPDPQFQDVATIGPNEISSARLAPGVDPIAEALRRGSILVIIRVGNIDLEAPNTPAMDAPNMYQFKGAMPPGGMQPPMGPMNATPQPGMLPGSIVPPAAGGPAVPGVPSAKASQDTRVQQASYTTPATGTAELAAKAPAKSTGTAAKASGSRSWWWPFGSKVSDKK